LGLAVLSLLFCASAQATTLRVGTGTGCDHATLDTALFALRSQTGSHTVRINKGAYAVPSGMAYTPTVSQTALFIEGGYDNCTAATPTGDVTSDADRAVFNGSGGSQLPVLQLNIDGLVGTVQLRRVVLTGGDATSSDVLNNTGGGLVIRGRASVLLGLGASIRGNSAVSGGGVVLMGATVVSGATDRADLYIDEGAEIISNIASERGGGIYCGGVRSGLGGDVPRHGTIIFRQGVLGFNQAQNGGGFHCEGSLQGGGGLQPAPRAGAAAWIVGNTAGSPGGCAAGNGTLDAGIPAGGDGYRRMGAADNENGLLAITSNSGFNAGLCLTGSYQLGSSTRPPGQSRFIVQNVYVADQIGTGVTGISAAGELDLIVQPSGNAVSCDFFSPTPCVTIRNNDSEQIAGAPQTSRVLSAGGNGMLTLRRADIRDNLARPSLTTATSAVMRLEASILRNNTVVASTPSPSSLFLAQLGGTASVVHITVQMNTSLDRFFVLEDTGNALVRASIFASSVTPAPLNVGGSGSPSNLSRQYCGFFQNTSDFASHSVINDPTLGTFVVLPPSSLQLDAATLAPLNADLIDACTFSASVPRDYYGNPTGVQFEPGSTARADIGAVERQIVVVDPIFANGFE
jgi:hypothetical protein